MNHFIKVLGNVSKYQLKKIKNLKEGYKARLSQ